MSKIRIILILKIKVRIITKNILITNVYQIALNYSSTKFAYNSYEILISSPIESFYKIGLGYNN